MTDFNRTPGSARAPGCPVAPYEVSVPGYSELVADWLANPHAYFKSFGPEARAFQRRHRSERLRTMTLVAPAEELVRMRPVQVSVDGSSSPVESWESAFALVVTRLAAARPQTFEALQSVGELEWMGCPADGQPFADVWAEGALRPGFDSLAEVVLRIQWLFLMCGIRLNEAIVQVDPYTDEQWTVRLEEIRRRRAEDKAFMEGRRAAQKAWAEAHPEGIF